MDLNSDNESENLFNFINNEQIENDKSSIQQENDEVKNSQKQKEPINRRNKPNYVNNNSFTPNQRLDENFQKILHNKITLNIFYTFCLKENALENLLFWLDVEIFQTVDKDKYKLYSNYIYYTYIDNNAPLPINITEEIRSDIDIENADFSNSNILEIFDEAQEHIYIMLKIYLYQKFELNPIFKKLQNYRKKSINRIILFF